MLAQVIDVVVYMYVMHGALMNMYTKCGGCKNMKSSVNGGLVRLK